MSVFEQAWAYPLAISIAVYAGLVWFAKNHLSSDFKDDLGLWILGAYKSEWSVHYSRFFDAIFGKEHLSWSCFLRSSVASVLAAVSTLYFLEQGIGAFDNRIPEEVTFGTFLFLVITVNLIPDYISLYETRILLGWLSKQENGLVHVLVLLVDFLASAAIILLYIFLYRWLFGLEQLALVEMVGLFSVYSVFFYSTFLTSVWAWLYVLSLATLRLFNKLGLSRVLNVYENPAGTVSLVIASYLFVILNFLTPALQRDDILQVSAFDQWLCNVASSRACPHVLRLTDDEQQILSIQIRVCEAEGGDICNAAGRSFASARDFPRAVDLFNIGCQTGGHQSCFSLALTTETENLPLPIDSTRFVLFEQSCNEGIMGGCAKVGIYHYQGWGTDIDEFEALRSFNLGCQQLDQTSCALEGWMIQNGRSTTRNLQMAHLRYGASCSEGAALGCYLLGQSLEYGMTDAINLRAAINAYDLACEYGKQAGCDSKNDLLALEDTEIAANNSPLPDDLSGCIESDALACERIGLSYFKGDTLRANPYAAVEYLTQACELGAADGCYFLARSYQLGRGAPQSRSQAVGHFKRSCSLGNTEACYEVLIFNPEL